MIRQPLSRHPSIDRPHAARSLTSRPLTEPAEGRRPLTEPAEGRRPHTRRPVIRRLLGWAIAATVLALAIRSLPPLDTWINILGDSRGEWVALAVVFQVLVVLGIALQQKLLMRDVGTAVRLPRMLGVTLAANAISNTVPAGAAVGAGVSVQQYRRAGAGTAAAVAVASVSGAAAAGGLVALVLWVWVGRLLADAWPLSGPAGAIAAYLAVAAGMAALWVTTVALYRRWSPDLSRSTVQSAVAGPPWRRRAVAAFTAFTASVSMLTARSWRNATAVSLMYRLFDAVCLFVCGLAVGAEVTFVDLVWVYLVVQLARLFPFTPGGLGVVELALVTGLTGLGVIAAPAAAAAALYRLLTVWAMIPIGYTALFALRSRGSTSQPAHQR